MSDSNQTKSKRLLLRFISAALQSNRLYIRPLIELIAAYAEFVGSVRTVYRSYGVLRAIAPDNRCFGRRRRDAESYLIANMDRHQFERLTVGAKFTESIFDVRNPTAICVDRSRSNGHYVATGDSIYYVDGRNDRLLNRFDDVWLGGIIAAADGQTLFVTDSNGKSMLDIDADSGRLRRRIYGNPVDGIAFNGPRKLVFYRSTTTPPDSVVFVATECSICRFDVEKTTMVPAISATAFLPRAIACTAAGILIFSCGLSLSMYAVYPINGRPERLAGGHFGFTDGDALTIAKFGCINDVYINDDTEQAWIIDSRLVRIVDLPPNLFYSSSKEPAIQSNTIR